MEFGPRHPHAIPPPTSPERLACGAAVRRSGPVSPPDRVPARAGTPLGHRQTDHPPGRSPPAACRVPASCRALPSPSRWWRTPARDHAGAHQALSAGGTPLGMGLPTLRTHGLPVQGWGGLHRRLPEGGAAGGPCRSVGMLGEAIRPHHPRLRHRDLAEPPLQKVRHGPRHLVGRGGPRVGLRLPRARGAGDAGAVVRHQTAVLEWAAPQRARQRRDHAGPVALALHDPHMPLGLRRMASAVQEVEPRLRAHRLGQGQRATPQGLPERRHPLPPKDGHAHAGREQKPVAHRHPLPRRGQPPP
jgi:hypothetical protein